MTVVYQVADGLSHQMARNGKAGQAMITQYFPPFLAVLLGDSGFVHVEVIAPASEFETMITHVGCFCCKVWKGKIGPLAGKQGDRSCHDRVTVWRILPSGVEKRVGHLEKKRELCKAFF